MLWTLWAGKEAAYKVMRKTYPRVSFSPRSYCVVLRDREDQATKYPCSGTVKTPVGIAVVHFFQDEETVHAIASSEHPIRFDELLWGVEVMVDSKDPLISLANLPSLHVREALIRRLAGCPGYAEAHMEIQRVEDSRGLGPPKLFVNGKQSAVDISLSHDGRFVSYAFC
jgi:hypothetical protein